MTRKSQLDISPAQRACYLERTKHHYPELAKWPKLPSAYFSLTDLGVRKLFCRIPLDLLRAADLSPHDGLKVQLFQDRVLIQQGNGSGDFPNERSGSFRLSGAGVQLPFDCSKFAALAGPGYLVLGTLEDVSMLDPLAPQMKYLKPHKAPVVEPMPGLPLLTMSPDEILAWKDFATIRTRKLYDATCISITASVLEMAGLAVGDFLHVQRYQNATVIMAGPENGAYSQLRTASVARNFPRLYAGPHIFDTTGQAQVRVLILDGKLVLTKLESELGNLGVKCLELPHKSNMGQLVREHARRSLQPPVDYAPFARIKALPGRRLQLVGESLKKAGLAPGSRYDVVIHGAELHLQPKPDGAFSVTNYREFGKAYVPVRFAESLGEGSIGLHVNRAGGLVLRSVASS